MRIVVEYIDGKTESFREPLDNWGDVDANAEYLSSWLVINIGRKKRVSIPIEKIRRVEVFPTLRGHELDLIKTDKARMDGDEKVAEFKRLLDNTTHVTAKDLHTPLK
jgi:hypothetical protein